MNTFGGMKIVESSLITEVPKLQLSHDFTACSETVKQSMNARLRDMFGTHLQVYAMGDTVIMHPKTVAMLRLQNLMRSFEASRRGHEF